MTEIRASCRSLHHTYSSYLRLSIQFTKLVYVDTRLGSENASMVVNNFLNYIYTSFLVIRRRVFEKIYLSVGSLSFSAPPVSFYIYLCLCLYSVFFPLFQRDARR